MNRAINSYLPIYKIKPSYYTHKLTYFWFYTLLFQLEKESESREGTLKILQLLRTKSLRFPLLLSIMLQMSQQFSGINSVCTQWRSQPDNLVPLCKFQVLYLYSFL